MTRAAQPLTAGQQRVFDVLADFFRKRRRAPTFRELGSLLGIRSTQGIEYHLTALEEKGWIEREAVGGGRIIHLTRYARGIPLVDLATIDGEEE